MGDIVNLNESQTSLFDSNDKNISEEELNSFGKIFDQIDNIEGDDAVGSLELLSRILELPDENFSEVAPILLDSFKNTFSSPAFSFMAKQMLMDEGSDITVIAKEFTEIIEELRNNTDEETALSPLKIDFLDNILSMYLNVLTTASNASKILRVPFELCDEAAKLPQYAHSTDSGADVYAIEDYVIKPGEVVIVKTGLKCNLPSGYELQVRPKSGLSAKTKLRVANTPGTIDEGYRDEIGIIIENAESPVRDIEIDYDDNGKLIIKSIELGRDFYIEKGQKIAQLVLAEVAKMSPYVVQKIDETGDRGGGFGSTGLK